MGGGVAGGALAAAVSEAGGLGTIGFVPPARLATELAAARALTGRPIAVNLLLPFAREAHWRAAGDADLVVTFWGTPRRRTARPWLHQCGSVDEVLAAERAGADGAIVQGVEAGGHVRGKVPALELLAAVRPRVRGSFVLWLAGGIAERDDVLRALDAGAGAAVAGTRFLATVESAAHPAYKARVVSDTETKLTGLFSLGWKAKHRVLVNDALRRWGGVAPALAPLHWATGPLLRYAPARLQEAAPRGAGPLLGPNPPLAGQPDRVVETSALYAGETVARIRDIRAAADAVRDLAP